MLLSYLADMRYNINITSTSRGERPSGSPKTANQIMSCSRAVSTVLVLVLELRPVAAIIKPTDDDPP